MHCIIYINSAIWKWHTQNYTNDNTVTCAEYEDYLWVWQRWREHQSDDHTWIYIGPLHQLTQYIKKTALIWWTALDVWSTITFNITSLQHNAKIKNKCLTMQKPVLMLVLQLSFKILLLCRILVATIQSLLSSFTLYNVDIRLLGSNGQRSQGLLSRTPQKHHTSQWPSVVPNIILCTFFS